MCLPRNSEFSAVFSLCVFYRYYVFTVNRVRSTRYLKRRNKTVSFTHHLQQNLVTSRCPYGTPIESDVTTAGVVEIPDSTRGRISFYVGLLTVKSKIFEDQTSPPPQAPAQYDPPQLSLVYPRSYNIQVSEEYSDQQITGPRPILLPFQNPHEDVYT